MRLYVMRHGQTDWNAEHRLQGHADIPLNERGRQMAAEKAEVLKDISFDYIYSSHLVRAAETAKLANAYREIPHILDERIQEIGFGEYEGICLDDDNEEMNREGFQVFFDKPARYKATRGGESFWDLTKRVSSFLDELAAKEAHQEHNVLIATHGATFCSILNYVDGNPVEKFWRGGVPGNCQVAVLEYKDGSYHLITENYEG